MDTANTKKDLRVEEGIRAGKGSDEKKDLRVHEGLGADKGSDNEKDLRVQQLAGRRYFIENLILIPDKNRDFVPFKFNRVQSALYNGLLEMMASGLPPRAIILKSSQIGITSVIMALFLTDSIGRENTTSVVIAHEEFITQRLLSKAKVFESSIPEKLKPAMTHRSAYELAWEENLSTFYIGSSRSFVFGRGERIDNALCSEIAFWHDPERITVPLGERVPRSGMLLYETTANGEDNFFYDEWQKAKGWKDGRSLFRPFFFPWWLCEEYKCEIDEGLPADATTPLRYDDDEKYMVKEHHLTEEQIRWRRMKLASPLGKMFFQEYPEDDQSCFLQIKEAIFDSDLLTDKGRSCYTPAGSYENALVWFPPEEGHIYVLGADPTVGRVKKAAATVWDLRGLKLCARLSGMYEPPVFAEKIVRLGRYYNNALLVVESNNPGVAVLQYLTGPAAIAPYPNLYYQRDLVTGRPTTRPGWTTTAQSKSYMIQQFKQLLPQLTIPDVGLIREARNFRYSGLNVDVVGEDDIMMSAMLALAARDAAPSRPALVGVSGWQRW